MKISYTNSNLSLNIRKKSCKFFFKLFKAQNLIAKCLTTLLLTKILLHFNKSTWTKFSKIQPFQARKLFFNPKLLELTTSKNIEISKLYNNYIFNKHLYTIPVSKRKRATGFMTLGNIYDILDTEHSFNKNTISSYKISTLPIFKKTKNLKFFHKTLTPLPWRLNISIENLNILSNWTLRKDRKKQFANLIARTHKHLPLFKKITIKDFSYLLKFYNSMSSFTYKQQMYSIFIRKNFHKIKFLNLEPLHMRLMFRYKFRRLILILFRTTRRYSTQYDPMFLHEPIISLNPGLMTPYFNKKKSLRKKKSLSLLLFRILRKIFIVSKINWLYYQIRGIPIFLPEYLRHMQRPIAHLFTNPVTGEVINEVENTSYEINSLGIKFDNGKPNCVQKIKKAGRLKRKISRKLTRLCNISD